MTAVMGVALSRLLLRLFTLRLGHHALQHTLMLQLHVHGALQLPVRERVHIDRKAMQLPLEEEAALGLSARFASLAAPLMLQERGGIESTIIRAVRTLRADEGVRRTDVGAGALAAMARLHHRRMTCAAGRG